METQEKQNVTDKIIGGLKKAVIEMEELRLQVALGKAEAKDLYEESKSKFNAYIHEAKIQLEKLKTKAGSEFTNVRTMLDTLQVQLALGKADTKDMFEEQSRKITKSLHELENHIKNNETTNEYYTRLLMEIEKFKIKLNILKLKYELRKLNAGEEFEEKKTVFMEKLAEIKNRMLGKEKKQMNRWEHFREEIGEAYGHLKNAFVH